MPRYFLGIDGGLSKTLGVLIDDEGHLLASACMGGSAIQGSRPANLMHC